MHDRESISDLSTFLHPKEKEKKEKKYWETCARSERRVQSVETERKNDEKGRSTREREREKERREEAFRGQFVHNVNCRNYYDIIIHPNCTGNRHAKCLIASSGGGKGAEDGIGGQRVETMREEKGTCN